MEIILYLFAFEQLTPNQTVLHWFVKWNIQLLTMIWHTDDRGWWVMPGVHTNRPIPLPSVKMRRKFDIFFSFFNFGVYARLGLRIRPIKSRQTYIFSAFSSYIFFGLVVVRFGRHCAAPLWLANWANNFASITQCVTSVVPLSACVGSSKRAAWPHWIYRWTPSTSRYPPAPKNWIPWGRRLLIGHYHSIIR